MKRKINWSITENKYNAIGFAVDVFMIVVVVINLAFIIFDWHFGFEFFRNFLKNISPDFYVFYRDQVHPNFLVYDLYFVAIYVTEIIVSWIIAIKLHTYGRWYFYPIVHWYDVLGCIPIGAFRWLRILRIFSLMVRLHNLGAVDLTQTYPYRKSMEIYNIIAEEISDRVVIKMLTGIQQEIRQDSPVTGSMVKDVLQPHKETIAKWMSHRIKSVTEKNLIKYKEHMEVYIKESIVDIIERNSEIQKINSIPVVGKSIVTKLEHGVSNATYETVTGIAESLSTEKSAKIIEDAINALFESMMAQEEDPKLKKVIQDIFIDSLEKVKEKVNVKQWKLEKEQEPV